jgi:hypothetical protein
MKTDVAGMQWSRMLRGIGLERISFVVAVLDFGSRPKETDIDRKIQQLQT